MPPPHTPPNYLSIQVSFGRLPVIATLEDLDESALGEILSREGSELLLSVPMGQRQEGFHRMQLNQTIRVPLVEIIRADLRKFSTARTGLLIGGGIGASVFLLKAIIQAFGEVELDNPIDPPEFNLNLLSIPISE